MSRSLQNLFVLANVLLLYQVILQLALSLSGMDGRAIRSRGYRALALGIECVKEGCTRATFTQEWRSYFMANSFSRARM